MTNFATSYELGASYIFPGITKAIAWKDTGTIEGVLAFARDEARGKYIRVYEVGPTEFVDGEPQAWSSGNFGTKEDAIKFASKAYRWINK